MVLAYYLSITAYCTPYNALIPELGHTQQERLNISTVISFTFIAGTAVAYLAPTIWGAFIPAFGRVGAIRVTFTLMAVVAFICMLVPVILHSGKGLRGHSSGKRIRFSLPDCYV